MQLDYVPVRSAVNRWTTEDLGGLRCRRVCDGLTARVARLSWQTSNHRTPSAIKWGLNQWCEAKKLHPFYFCNNFVKSRSILIIFGARIPEWICNSVITLPCKTKRANLFITTVMQALNVRTNWQLRTNASQQMFKVFCLWLWYAH